MNVVSGSSQIANAILVRTESSHEKCEGFALEQESFLLLVLEILKISEAADKENR